MLLYVMTLCSNPLISENMKTIYRVESPTGEVRVLEVSHNETGYNVYIDDSNICESITEEELTEALENPNF